MQDQSPANSEMVVDTDFKATSTSNRQKPLKKQAFSLYKRPRNYNFTIQEKMHFLDCLQQYIEVTENRRLDTSAVVMKKKTWELLVDRYNKKFPHGPPRNYAQLKDLYRRMKIHARKVYKQRSRDLEPGETPIAADEPTERLIEMMFSVNSLEPSNYLDLELREDVDVKPKIQSDGSDFSHPEASTDLMEANCSSSSELVDESRSEAAKDDSISQTLIWTSNGEVRLPTDIVVTEMPIYTSETSEGDASDGPHSVSYSRDQLDNRFELNSGDSFKKGISSERLNLELLEMARKEHRMKMKIHETSLQVLNLQKKKLQKELASL